MALIRPSWKSRGATYTEYGITIRCVGSDQIGMVRLDTSQCISYKNFVLLFRTIFYITLTMALLICVLLIIRKYFLYPQ